MQVGDEYLMFLKTSDFDSTKAFVHLEWLCTRIGPRVTGSQGETEAVSYIAGEAEAGGFPTLTLHHIALEGGM